MTTMTPERRLAEIDGWGHYNDAPEGAMLLWWDKRDKKYMLFEKGTIGIYDLKRFVWSPLRSAPRED